MVEWFKSWLVNLNLGVAERQKNDKNQKMARRLNKTLRAHIWQVILSSKGKAYKWLMQRARYSIPDSGAELLPVGRPKERYRQLLAEYGILQVGHRSINGDQMDPFVEGGPPGLAKSVLPVEMFHYIENIVGISGLKAAKVEIG
jgi:hypothetical protein